LPVTVALFTGEIAVIGFWRLAAGGDVLIQMEDVAGQSARLIMPMASPCRMRMGR
jgi:hypothetical protein